MMVTITTPRAAWFTIAVMLLAAWVALAAGSRAGAGLSGETLGQAAADSTGGEARHTLVPSRPLPAPGPARVRRNPFSFVQADQGGRVTAAALVRAAVEALASAPLVAPGPQVTLVGLAETLADGTSLRTAILSVDGEVVLVREGDVIAGRDRVVRITGDAVHLEAAGDGSPRVLRLR